MTVKHVLLVLLVCLAVGRSISHPDEKHGIIAQTIIGAVMIVVVAATFGWIILGVAWLLG
jgi:hypothetical protein